MTDIDERSIRALCEYMSVLDCDEYEDVVEVCSQSGTSYLVDARTGSCECEDALYNLPDDARCKHAVRARWATGRDPIPRALIDAVGQNADPYLGRWCDGEVREEGDIVETPDDGEILESDNIIEA